MTAHSGSYLGAFLIGVVYAAIGHDIQKSTSENCIVSYLSNGTDVSFREALAVVVFELMGSPKPVRPCSPMRRSDQFRKIFELERKWSAELKEQIDVIFASKTEGFADDTKADCIGVKLSVARPCAYLPSEWSVVSIKPLQMVRDIIAEVAPSPAAMRSLLPLAHQALEQSGPAAQAGARPAARLRIRVADPDQVARTYCLAALLLKDPAHAHSRAMRAALSNICSHTTAIKPVAFVVEDAHDVYRAAVASIRRLATERTTVSLPVSDSRFDSCVACGIADSAPAAGGEHVFVRPLVIAVKAGALVSNISGNFRVLSFKRADKRLEGDLPLEIARA